MLELERIETLVHNAVRNLQFRCTDQYQDEEVIPTSETIAEYHIVAMWDDYVSLWKLICYVSNEPVCIGAISMDVPEDDVIRMMSTIIYDLENYKD